MQKSQTRRITACSKFEPGMFRLRCTSTWEYLCEQQEILYMREAVTLLTENLKNSSVTKLQKYTKFLGTCTPPPPAPYSDCGTTGMIRINLCFLKLLFFPIFKPKDALTKYES
jgi:hypothetical protein